MKCCLRRLPSKTTLDASSLLPSTQRLVSKEGVVHWESLTLPLDQQPPDNTGFKLLPWRDGASQSSRDLEGVGIINLHSSIFSLCCMSRAGNMSVKEIHMIHVPCMDQQTRSNTHCACVCVWVDGGGPQPRSWVPILGNALDIT